MAVAAMGALCDPKPPAPPAKPTEITRERAIEIVRPQVQFKADTVEAVRATSMGREVWRVTFKGRLPDQPPDLFETRVFEIDVRTGEIVSASMN